MRLPRTLARAVITSTCLLLGASASAQTAPSPPATAPAPLATDAPPAPETAPSGSSTAPPPPSPAPQTPGAAPQAPGPAPQAPGAAPEAPAATSGPTAKLDGYVEIYASHNFNQPSNGITNFRGFDNRHDTFTLANAVLGATFDYESLMGRIALQFGETPTTYYLAEPSLPGSGGAGASGAEVFKYIQQAYAGWRAPVGRGLSLQAGVFLSPVGYEGIAVKDNWSWSRSNLFFGLPFYHTGLRASYDFTDRLSGMVMLSNGWNSVTDNNDGKSLAAQLIYKVPDRLTASVLYFGGPERAKGSPEGDPWRHLIDAWAQLDATPWLSFVLSGDAGFERNRFGTSYWGAGAVYARVQPVKWLYLAARGDSFWEHAASNGLGTASRIFWPADNVTSGTFTADVRPHPNLSLRLEYRHDQANGDMFFAGKVEGDGAAAPYAPNARSQDTLTAGLTGWL